MCVTMTILSASLPSPEVLEFEAALRSPSRIPNAVRSPSHSGQRIRFEVCELCRAEEFLQKASDNRCIDNLQHAACRSPNRCALIKRISCCLTQALRIGIAGRFVDRRKMLAEDVNRVLAELQEKAFGHQKMALDSTLPPHNDGAARRVSGRIESCFHVQREFL
jgi:hypothetical protein